MPDPTRLLPARRALRAHGVLWLALLALALRALVPAGYMPDARALHDGRLQVTFCSAAGGLSALSVALSPDGSASAGHDAADTGAQCPFGLLAHVAPATAPASTPVLLARSASVPRAVTALVLPTQAARGPPVGSRAPPSLA